ncbi:MAG TPA: hypothetical protein DHV48_02645 [Prolixibacteraceae bacterium]|nr:hypothetical protein [Prolixibacteraceae bacterium]
MKLFFSISLFLLLLLNVYSGYSQNEVEISGVRYLLHTVKKGETTFSLCQKYKVTQAELNAANPEISGVLKSGSQVKIPVKKPAEVKIAVQPNEKATASEPEYYYHKVTKQQTIFSIAKQYGITANELIRYNPIITNGLNAGQVLKIPVLTDNSADTTEPKVIAAENVKVSSDAGSEENFRFHTVVAGETLYSLGNKFSVSREELIRLNPAVKNGLQTGTRLKIPEKKELKEENLESSQPDQNKVADAIAEPESVICNPISGRNIQKYKAALLLPLNLQGNDQINISEVKSGILTGKIDLSHLNTLAGTDSVGITSGLNIDSKVEGFIEFYEGALLAIDSLIQQGMNIELIVFDASNKQMINGLLQLDIFRELDMIIGPVYPELQETVAAFAAKNRIPMISPLASTGNYEESNPYYFKVNPTREYQIEQTAQFIADKFSSKNLVLLQINGNSNSAEAKLAEKSKEKLRSLKNKTVREYSFQQHGLSALKPMLDENGENIFIIPTDNEAQVSVAVTNLTSLAEHFDVVLVGTSTLPKLKSIQTENYHRVRLHYLSPYFVDYTKSLTRRFVGRYRDVFSGEPTQFSFQGFDVTYYFLNALFRYGKDFRSCLPQYPMELTQMEFRLKRVSPMGGYMNKALFVTAWDRNFEILNGGIFGSFNSEN